MPTVVYSKDLNEKTFRVYMGDNRYKPVSFCPICKTTNTRIGMHLFMNHNWSRETTREFYRPRIVFVHSLAAEGDKLAASEWIKAEMEAYA